MSWAGAPARACVGPSVRQALYTNIPPATTLMSGATTARFEGHDLCNQPLISGVHGLAGEVVVARTTVPLLGEQKGSTVVILFERGDVRHPIIMGVLQTPPSLDQAPDQAEGTISIHADDDRLVLSAAREIVLRCGQSSITLTKAGKVLIKGAYVSTRSSGVNRIKGGSVQIN